MQCPRCENTTLQERDRQDVVIDICERCRGVWLDRGELEKLIARAQQEIEAYERGPERRRHDTPPRGVRYEQPRGHHDYKKKKKKGWLEVFEIFD